MTFSLSPSSLSVDENDGIVTFTLTRSNSVGSETVYVSTLHNQGYLNNNDYSGSADRTAMRSTQTNPSGKKFQAALKSSSSGHMR